MVSEHRFALGVIGWTAGLLSALAALAATLMQPGLGAARLVTGAAVLAMGVGLVRHVRRQNLLLARFVESLGHDDFAQRVDGRGGAGFEAVGRALNAAMRRLADERRRGADQLRFLETLVDDLPVAVLLADAPLGVRPANKLARRLFDRHSGTRPQDFAIYSDQLAERLEEGAPAPNEVLALNLGSGTRRAMVRTGTLARLGTPTRVVVVESVQAMLDAAEVGTQTDLVRVLTHEILNSLTPVTSLAGTAAVLLGEEEPDIAEARLAVLTLARRSEGLRRFIERYREVARPPEPRRRRFEAGPFATEIERLFRAEWLEHRFVVTVEEGLVINADPDLLAHALINLLRNAAQASTARGPDALVRMNFAHAREGQTISIEDNGEGIAPAMRGDIFLPFFTTRAQGTGVGLNLVRQIVVSHGWTISIGESGDGGARFTIDL